ncbi:hypothetical protein O3G_MSEX000886 [Manduca sexta]|nr:hypothetical protein O3G_MSEX000886 [Manduca sexta]
MTTASGDAMAMPDSQVRDNTNLSLGMMPTNIEKLIGCKNYQTWKFQMKLLLIETGLWKCMEENTSANAETDMRAYAKICLNISNACYPYVKWAKTARDAWIALKNAYDNVSIMHRLPLKTKLYQINYQNFNNMEKYISEIIKLTQELIEIGCNIDDKEIAEIMLIGLPNEFDPLIISIEGL